MKTLETLADISILYDCFGQDVQSTGNKAKADNSFYTAKETMKSRFIWQNGRKHTQATYPTENENYNTSAMQEAPQQNRQSSREMGKGLD